MSIATKGVRACPLLPAVYEYDDACALAEAYEQGAADPVDITKRCLDAAPTREGVYISLTKDRALREAEASRARYAAKMPLSPLDGVPLAWKDLFDVAGSITTAGSDLRRNNPPSPVDGPLPTLATRAGMVCPGKVNTTEFAFSSTGTNPHYGNPVNPHSKEGQPRIPGGSSCGSGVAVASGIVPLAMGSDTGGSIRIPSHFNGLTGFKPTVGHYNRGNMVFLAKTLDTPGPMTRSVRDVIAMDRILRGIPCPCRNPEPMPIKGRRFVLEKNLLSDPLVEDAVKAMLKAVIGRLQKAGAYVNIRDVPPFQEAIKVIAAGWFMGVEAFTQIRDILDDPERAKRIDQRIRKRAEGSRNMDPSRVILSLFARQDLIAAVGKDLNGDVLITPTVGHGAPLLNELLQNEETFFKYIVANVRLTTPGNLMDMPGLTIPAGLSKNGMPLSVLLSAASGLDELVLQTGLAAEKTILYT